MTKTGAGALTITGDLGTGGIALNANDGETIFEESQMLEALTIGALFASALALLGARRAIRATRGSRRQAGGRMNSETKPR